MPNRSSSLDAELHTPGIMHLRYIEMFQAILQAGTLTDAAALMNISQPAATKLLKQAERRMGFPLFVRARGKWHLTPESRLLTGQINRIADDLRDLQRLIHSIARAEGQMLRVITTPTLANTVMPKSLTRLRKQLGQTTIELSTQHSPEMLKSLLVREADVGFTLQELAHPEIRCEPLCQGPVSVIAPLGTWSRTEMLRPIAIEQLADCSMVSISKADYLGRHLDARLGVLNPPARVCIRVQTYQIARDLVCRGEGMALIDPFTAMSAAEDLQIRVVEPAMPLELYAAYRVDAPLNRVQRAFLHCVQAVAQDYIDRLPRANLRPVAAVQRQ